MRVLSVRSQKLPFVIKMIVYSLKIIGVAPFEVKNKSSVQISPFIPRVQAFGFSKIGLAYNILLLIPVLVIAAFKLYVSFENDSVNSSDSAAAISHIIRQIDDTLCALTAWMILINWGIRQDNAASIMNRLLEVDLELASFEKPPFNKRAFLFLIIHVLLNVCLWVFYFYEQLLRSRVYYYKFISSVGIIFPRLIGYWFITEYYIVVGIVANDIETVNNYLNNFKETGNFLFPPSFRHGMQLTRCGSQELAYRKLLHYHSIRMKLYKLCGDISDFFSLPMLFCIGRCFIPIFHSLFWLFRYSRGNSIDPELRTRAIFYVLATILMYAYPVVSLALNVTRIRKEAQQTRQIVDTLLEVAISDKIVSKLELFSRQLLHENISFTAYGFFSLDSSLLLSMLGGTATYFVALMQFPDNTCKCGRNSTTELATST